MNEEENKTRFWAMIGAMFAGAEFEVAHVPGTNKVMIRGTPDPATGQYYMASCEVSEVSLIQPGLQREGQ